MAPTSVVVAELRGSLISLRPFKATEIEMAWHGLAVQDETAHPRSGPEEQRADAYSAFQRRLERSGRLWRGCLDLAIARGGRPVGLIQARTRPKQTLPPGVFEIGLVLFRPQDRGKGYGREAVKLLTAWVFDKTDAERVQAGTAVDNAAMRAVLARLGFRLEGIARGYGRLSDGTRVDGAVYAMLKHDWQRVALPMATDQRMRRSARSTGATSARHWS